MVRRSGEGEWWGGEGNEVGCGVGVVGGGGVVRRDGEEGW